jgi:succinate dehydrogenase / fumarate reductase flavoprotein subunit
MSESLRNDGRIWAPKQEGDQRAARDIPEEERDYYLERKYPTYGNLAPRDIASRAAKEACDAGRGVGATGRGVYLDFADSIQRLGRDAIEARYGNLFEMYERITGENGYEVPMRIYPAPHYTMGGLWVDYDLQSNLPGLFVIGEANFSDHGANRLGASALMQGLADGYFVLPNTIGNYLSTTTPGEVNVESDAFKIGVIAAQQKISKLLSINGEKTVDEFHQELGHIMWENVGMARSEESLKNALQKIPTLRHEFWEKVRVPGDALDFNQEVEKALRLADFLEFGELLAIDALHRDESCGGHFRVEHQTPDGEAVRNDDKFAYVGAWEYKGPNKDPELHKEELEFENVKLAVRSYK